MAEDFTSSQGTLPNETPLSIGQLQSNKSSSAKSSQGRWTKEEHERFIEGMRHFGKNWRKVEQFIGTRSGAQIRSHAQKHFNRIARQGENSELNVYENFHNISPRKPETDENLRIQESNNFSTSGECLQSYQQFRMNNMQTDQITQQKQQQQLGVLNSQQNEQLSIQTQDTKLQSTATPSLDINMSKDILSNSNNSIQKTTTTKKTDWSKILSEQEKLKEMNQKTASMKEIKIAEKQESKDFKANSVSAGLQNSFHLNHLNQNTQSHTENHNFNNSNISLSDLIDQTCLATIFEPADIQTHLLSFYKAQADLEQLLVQSIEQASYDNKIPKKKRKIEIPKAEEFTQSLSNSCHSGTTLTAEDILNYHFIPTTHPTQTMKPSPVKQSTLNCQTNYVKSCPSIQSTISPSTINQFNNNNSNIPNSHKELNQSPQISDQQLIQLFYQFMGSGFQPQQQQPTQYSQHSYLSQSQASNNSMNYLNSLHHDDAWCNTLISAITQESNSIN